MLKMAQVVENLFHGGMIILINPMPADDIVKQRATASEAIVLIWFSRIFQNQHQRA